MSNEITVTVRGFCGTTAKLNEAPGRRPWAQFRLASTPSFRNPEGGWRDGETTWLTVKTFGDLARNVGKSVRKSDPVIVVGRLRTERWRTEDGVERESMVLVADAVGPDLALGRSDFTRVTYRAGEQADQEAGDEPRPGGADAAGAPAGAPGDALGRSFETDEADPFAAEDPDTGEIEAEMSRLREPEPAF